MTALWHEARRAWERQDQQTTILDVLEEQDRVRMDATKTGGGTERQAEQPPRIRAAVAGMRPSSAPFYESDRRSTCPGSAAVAVRSEV